jgi:hypothetical protein
MSRVPAYDEAPRVCATRPPACALVDLRRRRPRRRGAAIGVIELPSRPVETLIAFSIAVSAINAIRPLVARGEALIAGGFGLVHGLAFASLLENLGLDGGSLVTTLFGLNLGIELTRSSSSYC